MNKTCLKISLSLFVVIIDACCLVVVKLGQLHTHIHTRSRGIYHRRRGFSTIDNLLAVVEISREASQASL